MLKLCVKLVALSAEWPGRRKTYGPGETRTHDHAFRGHLLYHWATSPYWTSRLSCHMVELEVSSCLIHYCQLRVIQLVPLVCCKHIPPTTTPTEMWIFQGNACAVLMISEFIHVMLKVCVKLATLSAEWPGRRKTYGPGETRTHDHAFRAVSYTHLTLPTKA